MLHNIYDIIETGIEHPKQNRFYSIFMLACIFLSLIPLCFKDSTEALYLIDKVTVGIFIIDYSLRLITADCKYENGLLSYIKYPFSFMAIIDLLSILPSLIVINKAFKALRIIRVTRLSRVLRATKTIRIARVARYSNSADILRKVLKKSKDSLILLSGLAVGYILSTALIIFNVEPQTFNSFFDAVYWATVSLTTVGYGDIYAVTIVGRIIEMISSFAGIAIVALPSGIITAEFVNEINTESKEEKTMRV